MAGLQQAADIVTDDQAGLVAQLAVRLVTCLLIGLAGIVLWLGLRRHLGSVPAGLIAVSTTATLCLAPNFHFLTADWVGAALALAAVGASLAPRRRWIGIVIGGLLLWGVVAVKVATLPWAVLGIGLIALLAWRRALGASIVTVVSTLVWLGSTSAFDPLELTWLEDSVRANFSSPLQTGFGYSELVELIRVLANVVVVSPVVVALPAAITVVVLRQRSGRTLGWGIAVVSVLLTLVSGIAQGQWYAYHFVGLPVVAAGLWAYAFAVSSAKVRASLIVGPLLAGGSSAVLLTADLAWRREVLGAVVAAYLLLAAATVLGVVVGGRDPAAAPTLSSAQLLAASIALSVCLAASGLPGSAYAFDGFDDQYTNEGLLAAQISARTEYRRVQQEIGAGTPVLYLAYGSRAYLLGNPTPCTYASPVFISRSTYDPRIRALSSYRDNLSCYTDASPARYLVMDRAWADVDRLEPALRDRLKSMFDCARALKVKAFGGMEFCPRV